MTFVIAILLGVLKLNNAEILDQFEFPKPEEYWFLQALPSIGMASICILVILRKESLRSFLIQVIKQTLCK
jgi:hypothetical protein